MMPMNNPITLIYKEMQQGASVLVALERVASQYPQAFPQSKMMQAKMILGGDRRTNLHQIVQNMAAERGVTVENVLRSIGVQI